VPAAVHGLARVDEQVREDARELIRITVQREARRRRDLDGDARGQVRGGDGVF
jgi:hypothetical protein